MGLQEKLARKLTESERKKLKKDATTLQIYAALAGLSPLGGIAAAAKNREIATMLHGKDFLRNSAGEKGSLALNHPVATHFVPLGHLVSNSRAAHKYLQMTKKGDTDYRGK